LTPGEEPFLLDFKNFKKSLNFKEELSKLFFRSRKHQIFNKGATKEEFQRLLKEAKFFDPSLMPTQTDFSPTKELGIIRKPKYKRTVKPQESRRVPEATVTPQESRRFPEATVTPQQSIRAPESELIAGQVSATNMKKGSVASTWSKFFKASTITHDWA